jgi:hypothetical protein
LGDAGCIFLGGDLPDLQGVGKGIDVGEVVDEIGLAVGALVVVDLIILNLTRKSEKTGRLLADS